MKLTFIIGNGFDISLGLKTRYVDVCKEYVITPSKNNIIRKFKSDLRMDKYNNYENWSDFEMAMAKYAATFDNENDFIMCVRDFKEFLVKYLSDMQSNFLAQFDENPGLQKAYSERFISCIRNFDRELTPNAKENINRENELHNYISFNYTHLFDFFARLNRRFVDILHIHGNLNSDIETGVDNIEQLGVLPYKTTAKVKKAFIKPDFLQQYDKNRFLKAVNMINESDVICVFGFSFGESDRTWLNVIIDWLLQNKNHHLICNVYDTNEYLPCNMDLILDISEERELEILNKLKLTPEELTMVRQQIHVPVGENIFDFSDIIKKSKEKSEAVIA